MAPRRHGRSNGGAGSGMDMDGSASGSFGASDGSGPAIRIKGWQGAPPEDLRAFIKRKSDVYLDNWKVQGDTFTAPFRSSDRGRLQRLNNLRFAGGTLRVELQDGTNSTASAVHSNTDRTFAALEAFLHSRYDPNAQLLNLANMKADPQLGQQGFFSGQLKQEKVFRALMKVAGERIPSLVSVSLEGNDIDNVTSISSLGDTFPDLANLSLANNRIQSINGLQAFRKKFPRLRELVLAGNGVANQQHAILNLFPRLIVLDGNIIRDESQLPSNSLPLPVVPRFFENDAVGKVAQDFLGNFFRLWDDDRTQLLSLYDDHSEFSVTLDQASPHITTSNKGSSASHPYLRMSRNAMRTSNRVSGERLALGRTNVERMFRDLPRTRHDISDADAFASDAWQVGGVRAPEDTGIIICVHGSFSEIPATNKRRSFDRTIIILQNAHGAMLVASDMLNIREQSRDSAFRSTLAPQQPQLASHQATPSPLSHQGTPGSAPSIPVQPQQPTQPASNPEQVVQRIMEQTRLNVQYASMCAQQANFDLMAALALFEQSRGQLPPNAYAPGS